MNRELVDDPEGLRQRVETAIELDDPLVLPDLLLELALDAEEWEWAQACCVQLSRHRNAQVRGGVLLAFGHLARRFGRLDERRIRRLVEIGLCDRHEFVRAQAESAAEDLKTFLAWDFEGVG